MHLRVNQKDLPEGKNWYTLTLFFVQSPNAARSVQSDLKHNSNTILFISKKKKKKIPLKYLR